MENFLWFWVRDAVCAFSCANISWFASTTKTTKILPLEKYPLYGIYIVLCLYCPQLVLARSSIFTLVTIMSGSLSNDGNTDTAKLCVWVNCVCVNDQ